MVSLTLAQVQNSNSSLLKTRQSFTAVFNGAGGGIGAYTLIELARTYAGQHGKESTGLRCFVIGRNPAAAQDTIDKAKALNPAGEFIYVKAEDLSLLADVDKVCDVILKLERDQTGEKAKIDCLVSSSGGLDFGRRSETPEGLDKSLSILYYSRIRFIENLLPLLLASPTPAHVLSIYAAGCYSKLFSDDLSLSKPGHYSYFNMRSSAVYQTTLFFEHLAQQHPGKLSLVHIFPGLVLKPNFGKTLPLWFRVILPVLEPFMKLFVALPQTESGQRNVFAATSHSRFPAKGLAAAESTDGVKPANGSDGVVGSGAYAVTWNAEEVDSRKAFLPSKVGMGREELTKKVVEHTNDVLSQVTKNGKFVAV